MRNFIQFLFAIIFFVPVCSADNPNFVFVFGDDINKDSIGCYGGTDIPTPNIDRLAREGIRYENAYATVAMCAPWRQELYSGRNPWRTQAFLNHCWSTSDPFLAYDEEGARIKSISHVLKKLGYRVALVGKRHIGPQETYDFEFLGDFQTNLAGMTAIRKFMGECLENNQKFCLFVASHDGHTPFVNGNLSGIKSAEKLEIPPQWLDTMDTRRSLRDHYAEVNNLDQLLGDIDALLLHHDLISNTLLMFSTEQGCCFPFAKWSCYADGLGTALIARMPGVIPADTVYEKLIHLTDVTPTFVSMAGGKIGSDDYDGKSLEPTFVGDPHVDREFVYGSFSNKGLLHANHFIYPIRSIRSQEYSLIWNPNFLNKTKNTMVRFTYDMLESGGPLKLGKRDNPEELYHNVTISWVNEYLHNGAEVDPWAKATIERIFSRPEFEFYDLKSDPREIRNLAESKDPEINKKMRQMKGELFRFLAMHDDHDPIATEKRLTLNKSN